MEESDLKIKEIDENYIRKMLNRVLDDQYDYERYFDFIFDYTKKLDFLFKDQSYVEYQILIRYINPVVKKLLNNGKNFGMKINEDINLIHASNALINAFNETHKQKSLFGAIIDGNSSVRKWKNNILQCQIEFFYSLVSFYDEYKLNLSNKRTSNERFFEFYDFYTPDISNKTIVVDLINEAIILIKTDTTLTTKAKQKIISQLESILTELHNPKTNWKEVFAKIRESIIILGALGSFAGGVVGLSDATQKLERAEEILRETSINKNYLIEQNNYQIIVNDPKLLNQNNNLKISTSSEEANKSLPKSSNEYKEITGQ